MTGTIVPLRSKEDETAVASRADELTADLVAARIERLLTVLCPRRAELNARIADLQGLQSRAEPQLAKLNAELSAQMSNSVALLDLLINQAEMFVRELTRDAPSA